MKRFFIIAVFALLISVDASANPAWVSSLSTQPVDGPHVKLTYLCDTAVKDDETPLLNYHGTSHSPWKVGQDTSMNTGSGVRPLHMMEMCDCHVPTGEKLIYQSAPGNLSYGVHTTVTVAATYAQASVAGNPCAAECALADAMDGGSAEEADAALPVATGGSSGTGGALSTGGVPGTGGAVATGGTPDSGGASGTGGVLDIGGAPGTGGLTGATDSSKPDAHGRDGGSCAFAPTVPGTAVPVLAVVAGLVMIWRRRRS